MNMITPNDMLNQYRNMLREAIAMKEQVQINIDSIEEKIKEIEQKQKEENNDL